MAVVELADRPTDDNNVFPLGILTEIYNNNSDNNSFNESVAHLSVNARVIKRVHRHCTIFFLEMCHAWIREIRISVTEMALRHKRTKAIPSYGTFQLASRNLRLSPCFLNRVNTIHSFLSFFLRFWWFCFDLSLNNPNNSYQ